MYFSYVASVIMLSLAIYGAWLLFCDIWTMFVEPRLVRMPSTTFLIVVKDQEHEIEDLIRYLAREIELADSACDVVVVDHYSNDLTPLILDRLAEEFHVLRILHAQPGSRPAVDALPLCRGSVVHVLELGTRLSSEEFMVAVCSLVRRDSRDVTVNRDF